MHTFRLYNMSVVLWLILLATPSLGGEVSDGGLSKQLSGPYCGVYSMCYALKMNGVQLNFSDVVKPEYLDVREGSTLNALIKMSKDHGIHSESWSHVRLDALLLTGRPALLHVSSNIDVGVFDHWVLLCGIKDGKPLVIDGKTDPIELDYSTLIASWDGTAIIVGQKAIDPFWIYLESAVRITQLTTAAFVAIFLAYVMKRFMSSSFASFLLWVRKKASGTDHKARSTSILTLQDGLFIVIATATLMGLGSALGYPGQLENGLAVRAVKVRHASLFVPQLSINDMKTLSPGRDLVVDARHLPDFMNGHIPGAINVPPDECWSAEWRATVRVSKDKRIIVYCQSRHCNFADRLIAILTRQGFEDVAMFQGGWLEWQAEKHVSKPRS